MLQTDRQTDLRHFCRGYVVCAVDRSDSSLSALRMLAVYTPFSGTGIGMLLHRTVTAVL
jgi:hypothetical protein